MKVYEKIVLDYSGNVVEETSYNWEGPVALAKGGGGGGSSSGTVDFPAYMKTLHGEWLDRGGAVTIGVGQSVTELIQAGLNASPYAGETAYDPDADISAVLAAMATYSDDVDGLDPESDWVNFVDIVKTKVDSTLTDTSALTDASTAHAKLLDDRLEAEVLPRFETGMRDINSVISSSFVIGKSVIEGFNEREVAAFDAKLQAQNYVQRNQYILKGVEDSLNLLQMQLNFRAAYSHSVAEAYRIKAVLKKEELDEQLTIDDHDYRWGLELYQYGSNVMSSISGSAVSVQKKNGHGGSKLGGAMSGAASGAAIGSEIYPGWGTAIGAVLGGIGGYLMG